jgi:hypothetical protein
MEEGYDQESAEDGIRVRLLKTSADLACSGDLSTACKVTVSDGLCVSIYASAGIELSGSTHLAASDCLAA